jgi:hypothetical protein
MVYVGSFVPKLEIRVNIRGSCNILLAFGLFFGHLVFLWPFGIFYGHLEFFGGHFGKFVPFWFVVVMHQEKSANPATNSKASFGWNGSLPYFYTLREYFFYFYQGGDQY